MFTTNYTTNVIDVYSRAFANVVTQSHWASSFVTVIDTNLYLSAGCPRRVLHDQHYYDHHAN